MRASRMLTVVAAVALLGVACEDDATGIPAGVEVFVADLTGAKEVPPVATSASGRAVITVLGNLVSWKVDVTNFDSVTIGHIHKGVADSAGGVMVDLDPTATDLDFSGTIATGSLVVDDSVLTHMRNGRAYVNIHSNSNPGGEIRGQTVKQ